MKFGRGRGAEAHNQQEEKLIGGAKQWRREKKATQPINFINWVELKGRGKLKEEKWNQSTIILFNEWLVLIWFQLFSSPAALSFRKWKIFSLRKKSKAALAISSLSLLLMALWRANTTKMRWMELTAQRELLGAPLVCLLSPPPHQLKR